MLKTICIPLVALSFSFSFCILGTSISETSAYPEFCQKAADNDSIFANFKRDPTYRNILEHVPYETGLSYLDIIIQDYPELLAHFDKFRENDSLGNPITYLYNDSYTFSPTTLRYIKIAGDLTNKFGDLSQMHIVEIGGGYGGQCAILSALGFASYTLIDLPECIALAKKYLETLDIKNVSFIESTNLDHINHCDLVISNYAFSEIDYKEQTKYWHKVIKNCPNGYLTMNYISNYFGLRSFSQEEFISLLYSAQKKGKVEKENPLTHPNNILITWKPSQAISANPKPLYPKYNPLSTQNAVSYTFSGGRFGDNLIAYFHAKWIAYKYNLPFLYRPFPFSDQLVLNETDQSLDTFNFASTVNISDEDQLDSLASTITSTLINIPYSPECRHDYAGLRPGWLPYIEVDWEDPDFKAELVRCLVPKEKITTFRPPKRVTTLAVHVRRGGGADDYEHARRQWPLKFPPDSYYIEQIARVAAIFNNKPLYVYIFTDARNPGEIVNRYKAALNNNNLIFDCRLEGNTPYDNVLCDFFSMTKFDCLIRSSSNYSIMAAKLNDYGISIAPLDYTIINGQITINETELVFKGH